MSEEQSKEDKDFFEQVKKDTTINVYDLVGDSRDCPNRIQFYTDQLRVKTSQLGKVKIKMDEIFHEKFTYYLTEHEIRFNPSDARRMAECDPKMLKVKKIYQGIDDEIKYLTNVMWNLREKNKCISNIIQVKKLEFGG